EVRLRNYSRIVLLLSTKMGVYVPITGFEELFKERTLDAVVVVDTTSGRPELKERCIVLDDSELVEVRRTVKDAKWELGKHIGLISYKDTPLKSIVAEGITTISADFKQMAASMADLIINNTKEKIENPLVFIERSSF